MMFVERQLNRNNWGKWLASVGGWCSVAASMFREIAPVLSGNCREMAGKCWGGWCGVAASNVSGNWREIAHSFREMACKLSGNCRETIGEMQCFCKQCFGKLLLCFREIVGKWLASVGGWCSVAASSVSGNCSCAFGKLWGNGWQVLGGMVRCCCQQCFGKLLLCFREIVGKWLASVGGDGAVLLPAMFREIGGKLLTAFGKWRASFRERVGKLLGRCSVSVSSVSGNCSCAFGKLSGNGWQVLGDGAVLLPAVFREIAPVLSGNCGEMVGKCWGGWCGVAASNVSGNWREAFGKLSGNYWGDAGSVSSVSGNCSCAFWKLSGNGWQVLGDGAVLLQAVFREITPVLSGNCREMAGKCWRGWCGVAASNVSGNWREIAHSFREMACKFSGNCRETIGGWCSVSVSSVSGNCSCAFGKLSGNGWQVLGDGAVLLQAVFRESAPVLSGNCREMAGKCWGGWCGVAASNVSGNWWEVSHIAFVSKQLPGHGLRLRTCNQRSIFRSRSSFLPNKMEMA